MYIYIYIYIYIYERGPVPVEGEFRVVSKLFASHEVGGSSCSSLLLSSLELSDTKVYES